MTIILPIVTLFIAIVLIRKLIRFALKAVVYIVLFMLIKDALFIGLNYLPFFN
ncbi:hypothetical protein MKX73_19330 [Solibacillus sp. FSL W7-1436]|uniref:hypothetical protein n=1 Tax=Solibacillus sp. FSL W7-1436 TaxID=2921705 RepID=UPI0030F70DD1